MREQPWHDNDLDYAAANAARRFDLDDTDARELVEHVAGALEDGGDAIQDAAWDVQEQYPDVAGEDFVGDVAESLGYEDIL
jgi:hypothetical protein